MKRSLLWFAVEVLALLALFFVCVGDAAPMVNEAHYLVKAKNYWQPDWCARDLFAASGKAHLVFYGVFGWPTMFVSLGTTAWIGRLIGWTTLAIGLIRLSDACVGRRWASLAIAVLWMAGMEYGNLAGEWVIGGIEGKVPAYGLVLAAMGELVHRRWNRVWVLLGIASAFHVLTGGWSVIAAMMAWVIIESRAADRQPLLSWWLILGGGLSLAGVVPAVLLTQGSSPDESTAAAITYSYFRISHHLLPSAFLPWWYVRHALLLMILFIVGRRAWRCDANDRDSIARRQIDRRLIAFVIGAVTIAAMGLLLGALPPLAPDLAARLLRYYWFRLSDAIVPLGMAVLVTKMAWEKASLQDAISVNLPKPNQPGGCQRWARVILVSAVLLVGYSSGDRMLQIVPPSTGNRLLGWDADANRETRQAVFRDWLAVCDWAKSSTPPDEVFLTPRHQQTFKWYAHRAEVVNWKDVPQDAPSLIQWRRRMQEVYPWTLGNTRVSINYSTLQEFRERYHVRYMIVDRRVTGMNLPLVRLYPMETSENSNYAVYELPIAASL